MSNYILRYLQLLQFFYFYDYTQMVAVLPNLNQLLIASCLEAMSIGRLVIGPRVVGIPEIIDGKVNGYLVKPKDSGQIAEKVIKLILDKNLLKFMSKNTRIKSKKYNVDTYITEIEEVYQDIRRKYENE